MSLISARDLGKHFGTQVLFQDVEFTVEEGARIGLIGANGTGKTTLLRIVLDEEEHEGMVARKKGLRIAASEQAPRFPEGVTVRQALLLAVPELSELESQITLLHEELAREGADSARLLARLSEVEGRFEHLGGYDIEHRADRILEGMEFPKTRHGDRVETLSGGERSRLAFARLLLVEPDLWLLDEPTNHLDLDGILFLERFLAESKTSAIIVSHDRHFLDSVTSETWEIEGARVWRYPAPYTRAKELREERLKATRRSFERQQEEIQKEETFIDRYRAGQRARQAAGRLKRLGRLERLARPEEQARVGAMEFPLGERSGHRVLSLRGLAGGYEGHDLFRDLTLDLVRGETLGIVGPNGTGKTTLLRILLGQLAPIAGEVSWGERVRHAFLSQHETFIDETLTPFRVLREAAPRRTEQELRNVLGAMLFRGDDVEKSVSVLSGGERKRLLLTRMLLEGHNVLVLDEPTNHLDLPSRETLELALASYTGTLIVVSHDRYFLDQLADRVVWVEDGAWRLTLGGFEEALAARQAARERTPEEPRRAPVVPRVEVVRCVPEPTSPYAKLKTPELEARIIACEERVCELEALFAQAEVFRNPSRLRELKEELGGVRTELKELEEEYATRKG